jgi:hypothetical protein
VYSGAGMVIQSSRGSIALMHLAAHVALRPSLGRQFSRSVYTRFRTKHTKIIIIITIIRINIKNKKKE